MKTNTVSLTLIQTKFMLFIQPKKAQEQVEILQKATEEKKEPAKPSRGRPKKYATAEEARLKRIEKTKESNARMKLKKQQQGKGIMDSITNTFNSAKML